MERKLIRIFVCFCFVFCLFICCYGKEDSHLGTIATCRQFSHKNISLVSCTSLFLVEKLKDLSVSQA